MTLVQVLEEIEYPETDGEPLGETDLHRNWMVRIHDMLTCRYRNQRVYVGSNLLVYFEEGQPYRYVVPDVVTSRSTRRHDLVRTEAEIERQEREAERQAREAAKRLAAAQAEARQMLQEEVRRLQDLLKQRKM